MLCGVGLRFNLVRDELLNDRIKPAPRAPEGALLLS